MMARISWAIVSCNVAPVRREIIPISRAIRASIVSCNAKSFSAADSLGDKRRTASRRRLKRRSLLQYFGCRLRHSFTRSTSIQPSEGFFLPAPLRHFFCAARRLAREHAIREQKRCRHPNRGSTANGCPQCAQSREGFNREVGMFINFSLMSAKFAGLLRAMTVDLSEADKGLTLYE